MKRFITAALAITALAATASLAYYETQKWEIHDMNRPMSPVVTPGEQPGQPPSDAVVLFDGKDLSQFVLDKDGTTALWKVENGYVEVTKTGSIRSKRGFGDVQMHIEWASPQSPEGDSQKRGNSGIFLMGRYEIQVLDAYNNKTYADGQAGSIYGQHPPLVNACRKPGEWQSYDIIFRRPIFKDGKLVRPARATVLHNGVLVQDSAVLTGPTTHKAQPPYAVHEDKLPFSLQDHNDNQKVRYRNIWVRELAELE